MEENVDTIIAKYGQKVPKKPRKSRVVILSIIIVIIIAAVAVGALEVFKNKSSQTSTPPATQVTTGPTAKAITEMIAADKTIAAATNYTLFRANATQGDPESDTSNIFYKHNGYDFMTNTTAGDGLRFTLNANASSSKSAITTAITTVLKNSGFTQTDQDTSSLTSYKVVTYVNGGSVCQVIDYTGSKQSNLEQSVLCSSYTGIETAYKNVQTLLTKADANIVASTKTVQQTTITDGAKSLLTMTVTPKDSSKTTRYYFGSLTGDYEYLGNRPTPSVDDAASYGLSEQLKKNIADQKWGTFLSNNIK